MNIILMAIPFFFLLIFIELALDKIRQTHYYRINDSINSLTAGILSRVTGIARRVIPFSMYALCFDYLSIQVLPDTTWVWIMAFILYDFCYYWSHRLHHEVNVLWASHVVHHSSEEYNLTTALRQTSSGLVYWVFYIPMAVVGVPVHIMATVGALNLVYQFWVHTRHVPKLGWYEWLFVTPSNHRVHHAQNQLYIDRNYGGVFILWDRVFGTFQEEQADEKPIYGIRKALHSWNPLWANVHVYVQLAKDCWHAQRWQDKFLVWFKPTGWRPADVEQNYPLDRVDLDHFKKYDIRLTLPTKVYGVLQHALTLLIAVMFLLNVDQLNEWQKWGIMLFIVFSSYSVGCILENREIAVVLEWLKNLLVCMVLVMNTLPVWLSAILWFGTSVGMLLLCNVRQVDHEKVATRIHTQ